MFLFEKNYGFLLFNIFNKTKIRQKLLVEFLTLNNYRSNNIFSFLNEKKIFFQINTKFLKYHLKIIPHWQKTGYYMYQLQNLSLNKSFEKVNLPVIKTISNPTIDMFEVTTATDEPTILDFFEDDTESYFLSATTDTDILTYGDYLFFDPYPFFREDKEVHFINRDNFFESISNWTNVSRFWIQAQNTFPYYYFFLDSITENSHYIYDEISFRFNYIDNFFQIESYHTPFSDLFYNTRKFKKEKYDFFFLIPLLQKVSILKKIVY